MEDASHTSTPIRKTGSYTTKKIINKLQGVENGVYRYLLGVNDTTPVTTLRGEVGASEIESRIMETMLTFTSDTLQGKFHKVKDYMRHELETGKGKWARAVNKYRQKIGLSWEELTEISKKEIKKEDKRQRHKSMERKDGGKRNLEMVQKREKRDKI